MTTQRHEQPCHDEYEVRIIFYIQKFAQIVNRATTLRQWKRPHAFFTTKPHRRGINDTVRSSDEAKIV